jgi:hypothetical protein
MKIKKKISKPKKKIVKPKKKKVKKEERVYRPFLCENDMLQSGIRITDYKLPVLEKDWKRFERKLQFFFGNKAVYCLKSPFLNGTPAVSLGYRYMPISGFSDFVALVGKGTNWKLALQHLVSTKTKWKPTYLDRTQFEKEMRKIRKRKQK